MTHLGKIAEEALFEESDESAAKSSSPGGRWSVLMNGWLSAPRRLSAGDVSALAELLRRREAVSDWQKSSAAAD